MNHLSFNLMISIGILAFIVLLPKDISSIRTDLPVKMKEAPNNDTESKFAVENILNNSTTLNILTYNVYMLPYLHILHKTYERAQILGKVLKDTPYHIIVFQEVFHRPSRIKLMKLLADEYPYFYGPYDEPVNSIFTSSGVMVASKIPLKLEKKILLKNLQGFDKLARKSAYLFKCEVGKITFYLLATHLQSNEHSDTRKQQLEQLYTELIQPYEAEGIDFIIAGDLNVNSDNKNEYNSMIKLLRAHDNQAQLNGAVTYDEIKNGLARTTQPRCRSLDYILIHSHINPDSLVTRKVVPFKNPNKEDKNIEDLSDHYALEAKISWKLFDKKKDKIETDKNKHYAYHNPY